MKGTLGWSNRLCERMESLNSMGCVGNSSSVV